MLREIHILRGTDLIYCRQFGDAMLWEIISPILFSLSNSLSSGPNELDGILPNIMNYKVSYSSIKVLNLLFVFVSDLTDNDTLINKQLKRAKEQFQELFSERVIESATNPNVFDPFNPIADLIHKDLRPKIALVGFSGVGKTTITKLIRADEIPKVHNPTMTGDIYTVKIGKLHFNLWDFAGQEQFSFLWPKFLKDSDAVLIITDSTLKNIEKSKFFIDLTREKVPTARLNIVANKQDLPGVLLPQEIEKILGVKTNGMIGVDPNNRAKMIEIVAQTLGITSQVSPLIRPLLDRDKLVEEAEAALMEGEFTNAIKNFEDIAKYCIELGESKIASEFLERAKFIKSRISEDSQSINVENNESDEISISSDSEKTIENNLHSESENSSEIEQKTPNEDNRSIENISELPSREDIKQELLNLESEVKIINISIMDLESERQKNIISENEYQKKLGDLRRKRNDFLFKITQVKISSIK